MEAADNYYVEHIKDPPPDPLVDIPMLPMELYTAPPQPPLNEVVGLTGPGHWSVGSLMLCRMLKDGDDMPPDIVCSWVDNSATYYLQKRPTPKVDLDPEGDSMASRFPSYCSSSCGIWTFSHNVFCKVKPWVEGLTTEATTIRFINEHVPSVPTEKVIYFWIDPMWNSMILITRRVTGKTYQAAWPDLTIRQRLQVADQVAGHLQALARMTSDWVETVQGTGIEGAYCLRERESLPHKKPRIESRVSREDYLLYLERKHGGIKPPGAGEPLVLQHPDVHPSNFFVTIPSDSSQMPKVTAIIDWEWVGYYPKWEASTLPRAKQHFMVETIPQTEEGFDWQWMLSNALVRAGFPLELEYIKARMRGVYRHYPGVSIERFVNCKNLPI